MTPLQAMKQALEYLRLARDYGIALGIGNTTINDAIRDQLTAIAEMEKAEPVVCIVSSNFCECNKQPLYAHPQQQTIPEGWQLVPKEPTEEKDALEGAVRIYIKRPNGVWERIASPEQAMLAATPKPEDKP